jgi:hypothetical protein
MKSNLDLFVENNIRLSSHDDMGQIFNKLSAELIDKLTVSAEIDVETIVKFISNILNIDTKMFFLSKSVDDDVFENLMEDSMLFDWKTPNNKIIDNEEYFLFEKYFTEEDAVAVYAKKRK